MSNGRSGDSLAMLLVGAVAGAAAALLLAPDKGERTRRKIRRRAEDSLDYLVDAGKDLVDNCEDLYRRSSSLANDGAQELSDKYRDLLQRSQQLVKETRAMIQR